MNILQRKSLYRSFALLIAPSLLAAQIPVSLDFSSYRTQIDALDGASMAQFWRPRDSDNDKVTVMYAYSTLEGFPRWDDTAQSFGKLCSVCFSGSPPKGMALHQTWSYPSYTQSPEGSLGDTYTASSWDKMDFSMYEPQTILDPSVYSYPDNAPDTVYGHTALLYRAFVAQAREEKRRVMVWVDNIVYPAHLWGPREEKDSIPFRNWEKAALYLVFYCKYLVARHGIPIHALSIENEPDCCGSGERHIFTPESALRFCKVVREKLDQAGLTGIKLIPGAWWRINKKLPDQIELIKTNPDYAAYADIIGGHTFAHETPTGDTLSGIRKWIMSGSYSGYFDGGRRYSMGSNENVDETARHPVWYIGQGYSLTGTWQLHGRVGIDVSYEGMPQQWNPYSSGRHRQIDGGATVLPYVRPGMFLVAGSQARRADDPYSVDGFGGRGHREVIVITNSDQPREFAITVSNSAASTFNVYQCSEYDFKQDKGTIEVVGGKISLRVPANSVTSLVAENSATHPRVYLIAGTAESLSEKENRIVQWCAGAGFDTRILPQQLGETEKNLYHENRHPVDAMGAALYILSSSITDPDVVMAYKTVMAPCIALGAEHYTALGLSGEGHIDAGTHLELRNATDPPESLLDSGSPLACGNRTGLSENPDSATFIDALNRAFGTIPSSSIEEMWTFSGEIETRSSAIKIVPGKRSIRIDMEQEFNGEVELFSLNGRRIAHKTVYSNTTSISTRKKGIYLLRLTARDRTASYILSTVSRK
jgi:hypothetical protein